MNSTRTFTDDELLLIKCIWFQNQRKTLFNPAPSFQETACMIIGPQHTTVFDNSDIHTPPIPDLVALATASGLPAERASRVVQNLTNQGWVGPDLSLTNKPGILHRIDPSPVSWAFRHQGVDDRGVDLLIRYALRRPDVVCSGYLVHLSNIWGDAILGAMELSRDQVELRHDVHASVSHLEAHRLPTIVYTPQGQEPIDLSRELIAAGFSPCAPEDADVLLSERYLPIEFAVFGANLLITDLLTTLADMVHFREHRESAELEELHAAFERIVIAL